MLMSVKNITTTADEAPGQPGLAPRWTSSAKEVVGSSLGPSRLWYTISHGILNEVYYPRVDIPQIRDLGFIVADGKGFWVEVKRLAQHETKPVEPGIPLATITHHHERFELTLRITPCAERDVLLIEVTLQGDPDLSVYALLAPHLGGTGHDNHAAVARYRGRRMLWAEQGPFGLALAAVDRHQRDAWRNGSAGYVGISDGWQDFAQNGSMCWQYAHAGPGNVALMGKLPRNSVLALGLATSKQSAATLAISSLLQPFEQVWQAELAKWQHWHMNNETHYAQCEDLPVALRDQLRISAMVLRVHQDKIYPGAMVASLSIPWGNTKDDIGGYHLVWPRDLVESAGALLVLGAVAEAQQVLRYLIATQHADGHWYQNQWLGGKPYWQAVQLDEAAFPVLLATSLAERGLLDGIEVEEMVTRALSFIASHGPASDQDRWEENSGINPFTLAICIAALVSGADFLAEDSRRLALQLADYWNANIEHWTSVDDTELQKKYAVGRYFIRVSPLQTLTDNSSLRNILPIKNRTVDPGLPGSAQIGTECLQLVRFGLRRADHYVIQNSIKLIDALLKVETPNGPGWHRYNGDGYGEHPNGAAFDGTGQGRVWPLLSGERGHYELVNGKDPLEYIQTMLAMSGIGGMLPEQVWDTEAIPGRPLQPGQPSGSAMPLVWAHAEFVKLVFSRQTGNPVDRPACVWRRYQGEMPETEYAFWLQQAPISHLNPGRKLYIGLHQPATIRWGINGWQHVRNMPTADSGFGLHIAEIDTSAMAEGSCVNFTYRNAASGEWVHQDYQVSIVPGPTVAEDR